MTPEAQRIAISEACGWVCQGADTWIDSSGKEWQVMYGWQTYKDGSDILPDYLNDLNAMHEAENVLFAINDWRLIRDYFFHLSPDLHAEHALDGDDWKLCHATAPQRAEAFLKTLNLWTP